MHARQWHLDLRRIFKRFPELAVGGEGITIVDLFGVSPIFLRHARKWLPKAKLVCRLPDNPDLAYEYPDGVEFHDADPQGVFNLYDTDGYGPGKIFYFAEVPDGFSDNDFLLRVLRKRSVALYVLGWHPFYKAFVGTPGCNKFFITSHNVNVPYQKGLIKMLSVLIHREDVRYKIPIVAEEAGLELANLRP